MLADTSRPHGVLPCCAGPAATAAAWLQPACTASVNPLHRLAPSPPSPPQTLLALKRANLQRKIGKGNIHVNVGDAVERAEQLVQRQMTVEAVDGV